MAVPVKSILLLLAATLSGCGLERPQVLRSSMKSFDHVGFESSCMGCHEALRPAPVLGVAHGNGGDCVTCHTPSRPWASPTAFDHNPVPASCVSCHESQRPALSSWPETPASRAGHFEPENCASCHTVPAASFRWLFKHRSATGDVGTCIPCHETKGRDKHGSANPEYFLNGGNCATCHVRSNGWNPR